MKYMGSKARIAKHILPLILRERVSGQLYVEPFVGGCNTIDKVNGNRLASDNNEYLIEMYKMTQNGWKPPLNVTEDEYNHIKNNKDDNKALTGYIGFALSYGGKWFGGYRRDKANLRNYSLEAYKAWEKQLPYIMDIRFQYCSYLDLDIPRNSIIYCDPPYKGTTSYKTKFNHEEFYVWCRKMKKLGNSIFISEYTMPKDFKVIWEKEIKSSLTQNTGAKTGIEKLFTL